VGLTGLILEHPFLKGTFDLVGITPRMDQRREYKNAMNFYTHEEFTEAHAESLSRLLESWFSQMVRGIAEGRGLKEDQVRTLADGGPHYGQEAVDAGLVDGLAYRDQAYDKARERVEGTVRFLDLNSYLERAGILYRRGPSIAVIYGVGTVLRGKSHYAALSGEFIMGSDTVSSAIRAAVDDPRVEAIILRVDCPGGSYPASDAIYHETVRAREAGKPVIVSMGNYAASGGYFVSLAADKIVAQPGTLTASIGVFGGKMLNRDMWKKIGMTFDEVHTSENAAIWSSLEDYSDEEWARLQAWLDRVYGDFTGKVAAEREIDLEQVLEIARGRVWTGEDALERGLVDELGGLVRAIELAKEAAGLEPGDPVRLKRFPARRSTLEMFLDMEPDATGSRAAAQAMTQTLQQIQPYGRLAGETLGGPARHGVLSMPPLPLPRP
jgi:protease-4